MKVPHFLKKEFPHIAIICLMVALGLSVRIIYLSYTNFDKRAYDVGNHVKYVQYVAKNLRIPAPEKGWENAQAPLYYITAAITYRLAGTLSLDHIKLLQILSLTYSTISLIFGVLLLKLLFNRKLLFYSSAMLFLLWPSGIIHSIRISNDPMYYMMSIISLYFLIKWIYSTSPKYFYSLAIFIALTIAVKLNGMVLLGITSLALIYKYCHSLLRSDPQGSPTATDTYLKQGLFLLAIVLLSFFLSYSRNIKAASTVPNFNIISGNTHVGMPKGLVVKNAPQNYLFFDTHAFIAQTFTTPWKDGGGRQYFWNYLLKTMLFGEFTFAHPFKTALAMILNLTFVIMASFFFIGFINALRKVTLVKSILLVYLLFALASLMYYRHHFPFSANGDFRFIFPVIIPCIYFYFSGIDFLITHKLKVIGVLGYIATSIFIVTSYLFFLSPLFRSS